MREYLESAFDCRQDNLIVSAFGCLPIGVSPIDSDNKHAHFAETVHEAYFLESDRENRKLDLYLFEFEIAEVPVDWENLVWNVLGYLKGTGCLAGWISTDPGFSFENLFNEYFSSHCIALYEAEGFLAMSGSSEMLNCPLWQSMVKSLKKYEI